MEKSELNVKFLNSWNNSFLVKQSSNLCFIYNFTHVVIMNEYALLMD